MSEKRCLITDKMHESIISMLADIGYSADYRPHITREEIKSDIKNYDGLVIRSKTWVDEDLLAESGNLKFVARAGAGVDMVKVEALERLGIHLVNAPEGNRDTLGEHAVGMLLSLLNRIHLADAEVRNWKWLREQNRGHELKGKTIGIIGYGNMGKAFAERLAGFGCEILAYDRFLKYPLEGPVKSADEEQIFQKTDVLSIHIPYSSENHHFVDEDYLRSFEKPIYLINTARGGVINLHQVIRMMREEQVIGVALDVLPNEKLDTLDGQERADFEYLIKSPRSILTPHVAGWSQESYKKINRVLCDKISRLKS